VCSADNRAVQDLERKSALMHFSSEQAAEISGHASRFAVSSARCVNPRVAHVHSLAKPPCKPDRIHCHVMFTHDDGSCEGRVFMCICLSVFRRDIPKSNADRITKLDIEMFFNESWKPIYFGIKRSRSRATKTLLAWVLALLLVVGSSGC